MSSTPQRTLNSVDEADHEMVDTVENVIDEAPVVVEGDHMSMLHTVDFLPKAIGSISPPL